MQVHLAVEHRDLQRELRVADDLAIGGLPRPLPAKMLVTATGGLGHPDRLTRLVLSAARSDDLFGRPVQPPLGGKRCLLTLRRQLGGQVPAKLHGVYGRGRGHHRTRWEKTLHQIRAAERLPPGHGRQPADQLVAAESIEHCIPQLPPRSFLEKPLTGGIQSGTHVLDPIHVADHVGIQQSRAEHPPRRQHDRVRFTARGCGGRHGGINRNGGISRRCDPRGWCFHRHQLRTLQHRTETQSGGTHRGLQLAGDRLVGHAKNQLGFPVKNLPEGLRLVRHTRLRRFTMNSDVVTSELPRSGDRPIVRSVLRDHPLPGQGRGVGPD